MHFKVYNTETKEYITNAILTPTGRVYECTELGDNVDPDAYFAKNCYLDNLSLTDITDKVELVIPN